MSSEQRIALYDDALNKSPESNPCGDGGDNKLVSNLKANDGMDQAIEKSSETIDGDVFNYSPPIVTMKELSSQIDLLLSHAALCHESSLSSPYPLVEPKHEIVTTSENQTTSTYPTMNVTTTSAKLFKVEKLLHSLDDIALCRTRDGREYYPNWISNDIKDLYHLLLNSLVELSAKQRKSNQIVKDPSSNVPLARNRDIVFKHCSGAQYCLDLFRIAKRNGKLWHVKGVPNGIVNSTIRKSRNKRRKRRARSVSPIQSQYFLNLFPLIENIRILRNRLEIELKQEKDENECMEDWRARVIEMYDILLRKFELLLQSIVDWHENNSEINIPQTITKIVPEIKIIEKGISEEDHLNALNALKFELDTKCKAYDQEINELRQRLDSVIVELDRMKSENSDLTGELHKLRALEQESRKTKIRLTDRVRELEAMILAIQSKMQIELESKENALKRIGLLEDTITSLHIQLQELKNRLPNDEYLSREIDELKHEILSLKWVLLSNRLQRHVYIRKYNNANEQLLELRSQLEIAKQHITTLELSINERLAIVMIQFKQQIDSYEIDIQNHNQREKEMMCRIAELEARHAMDQDEIAQLSSQLQISSQQRQLQLIEIPNVETIYWNPIQMMLRDSFVGDYVRVQDAPAALHVLMRHGDDKVRFSDRIEHINRRNRKQKRVFVIGNKGVYVFIEKVWELTRNMSVNSIEQISLSRNASDLLALHHKTEHDVLMTCPKRSEIMFHLLDIYARDNENSSSTLPYRFTERFYIEDNDMHHRDIEVPETQTIKLGRSMLIGPA